MDDGVVDKKTLSALNLAQENMENFQARALENLHSKVILIDRKVFYLGSANWYWYSLNEALEVTIAGDISQLPELVQELDQYWLDASPINIDEIRKYRDFAPVRGDICGYKEK